MSDTTQDHRRMARDAVLSLLAGSGRPLRAAEIVAVLRGQGITENPGGVILALVGDGVIAMGDDRRLRLEPISVKA